jgi:hypothetical protein
VTQPANRKFMPMSNGEVISLVTGQVVLRVSVEVLVWQDAATVMGIVVKALEDEYRDD